MPAITKDLPGQTLMPGIEPVPRRWLKVKLDERGHAIVSRAIVLKLASIACTEPDDDQLAGQALVMIAKAWMETEVARLSGG